MNVGDVPDDDEDVTDMRNLGENMGYILKKDFDISLH